MGTSEDEYPDVDRIKNAVNAADGKDGQVESGGDVSIVAMEITRNQQTLNTFYNGFGEAGAGDAWWRRFGRGNHHNRDVQGGHRGRRSVDSAKTKQLIWRGATSDTLLTTLTRISRT